MRDEIKQFIERNIDLIEQNMWEEIYEKAQTELDFKKTGRFTEIMLAADIHPELYLKELPKDFSCDNHNISKFEIPNHITSIGKNAFEDCSKLTSIVIPNSVTSIDEWAFKGCASLVSVIIGDNVTSIGSYAFFNCNSLVSITIPDKVIKIGYEAFWNSRRLKNVIIGNSVTSIGYRAFYNCNSLTSINIPNTVTDVRSEAFRGCGDKLVIEYDGSKEQWEMIYDPKSFKDTYFTVNCRDGKIIKSKR